MIMLLFALAAAADTSQPVCVRKESVPGFESWGHPAGPALAIGNEATLALKPATGVAFKPALTRPAKAGTFGGYFPINVTQAGRYRIASMAARSRAKQRCRVGPSDPMAIPSLRASSR